MLAQQAQQRAGGGVNAAAMNALIARVQGLLLDPQGEWAKIDRESGEPAHLFLNYVVILALIPALAEFIGASIIGVTVSVGTFRVPVLAGLLNAVISYLFSFVLVYVVALVIDALAPSFGTARHFPSALKLSVYSFTPAWLAGIFLLLPGLSFLTIAGLYGFFLLLVGLPIVHADAARACARLCRLGYCRGICRDLSARARAERD